jgi:transposase-like protein
MKKYYELKSKACEKLASLDKKKIQKSDIKTVAKEFNLKPATLARAWENTLKFGKADLRIKTGKHIGAAQFVKNYKTPYFPVRLYTNEFIKRVVVEYIVEKIKHLDIINKYGINSQQFYSWVKDLNVSGKIGTSENLFLDWTKYKKEDIKLARKRKLNANLKRIVTVFKKY